MYDPCDLLKAIGVLVLCMAAVGLVAFVFIDFINARPERPSLPALPRAVARRRRP